MRPMGVWAMNRPRKEHQSLGALALALGLAWSVVLLLAGASGFELAHGTPRRGPAAPMVTVAVPVLPPPAAVDPEAARPVRALDFAALEPIQAEVVKSTAHGGRWIRTWSSPAAAQAYRAGEPLPAGALVVVSSVEDRWGRPGTDPGPLYVLEMKAAGPALAFYWPRIPMDRRREFGGESQAYWREGHPGLEACRSCHRAGMADPTLRSRWRARRADAQD